MTSQNPVNYEALEKYGRDLVRQGKMDPVIVEMKKP